MQEEISGMASIDNLVMLQSEFATLVRRTYKYIHMEDLDVASEYLNRLSNHILENKELNTNRMCVDVFNRVNECYYAQEEVLELRRKTQMGVDNDSGVESILYSS